MSSLATPVIVLAALSLAASACGDDSPTGAGGAGGGSSTASSTGPMSATGTGGAGGGGSGGSPAYLCQLSVCPDGDAQVETCPVGSACYELEDCPTVVLCEQGACEGVDLSSTECELTGRRCVVDAGDCKRILRCDDADAGPEWVTDGEGPCSEG